MARNNVSKGSKAQSSYGNKNCCNCAPEPMPMESECDAIKNFTISMGVISGVTCGGEMFSLPINAINPKSNKNESINEILFELCKSSLNIKAGDNCINLEKDDCNVEISLNVSNLINKICSDDNAKMALLECLEIENNLVTSLTFDDNILTLNQSLGDSVTVEIPEFTETVTNIELIDGGFTYQNENNDIVTYLSPVTSVTSDDGTVTVINTGTSESPIFDLSVTHTVDINTDTFSYDPSTKTITLVETDGTRHQINISDLIDTETVTNMVIQVDGSTIYTNESGVETVIPAPVSVKSTDSSVIVQSTGTSTAPCYDLSVTHPSETVTRLVNNNDGSLTYVNEIGEVVNYSAPVAPDDVVTRLTDNNDNSFTYVNELGESITIDYCDCDKTQVLSSDGSVNVINTGNPDNPIFDLSVTHTVDINTDSLSYDPLTKSIVLIETDGTSHSINISDLVDTETRTTLIINNDGSATYTNEVGETVTIPGLCNSIEELPDVGRVQDPLRVVTFDPVDGGCGTGRLSTTAEICDDILTELESNSDKASQWRELLDIRAVSFDFNDNNDTATITMSDGTILSTVIEGFIENGVYSPNLNGSFLLPLTGGGTVNLVPNPDVDFESTTVTVNANGETVITYLDSEGNIIDTSVIMADQNDFLSTLNLAPDGCTLTATLDSGTMVSVDLCDLVSDVTRVENPDGSSTYTHTSNNGSTSWTIPVSWNLISCDGSPLDISQPITVAQNPLVSCEVINCTRVDNFCDGTSVRSYTDKEVETIKFSLSGTEINSSTPEGQVLASACSNITVPECGRVISVMSEVSSNISDQMEGTLVIRAQVSFTGPNGTFLNMATGGQDALQYNSVSGSVNTIAGFGEFAYTDFRDNTISEGPKEICFRLVIERNDILNGSVSLGIADARFEWLKEVHK